MLRNAHLLAKIGGDTAESEWNLAENLLKNLQLPHGSTRSEGAACWRPRRCEVPPAVAAGRASASKFCNFVQNFANFGRARSRLYQNEILQENMRLTAFFKLYKICILLHRCNLKIFAKNRFEKTAIFVKFQQQKLQMLQMSQNLQNFVKIQNFSLRIW